MKRWWWWALAGTGLALLLVAAWKTYFSPDPGAALVALVVTGGALLVSPFVLPHLQAIALNADGFELRLVREMSEQGAPETARLLNNTELAEIAEAYGIVHTQLVGDLHYTLRKQVQDQLVSRASAFARQHTVNPDEIRKLFPNAPAPVRVLLLGLMLGDPRLVDVATLTEAVSVPVTANEQYQALLLIEKNLRRFTDDDRAALMTAIDGADLGREGSDRRQVAARIKALPTRAR